MCVSLVTPVSYVRHGSVTPGYATESVPASDPPESTRHQRSLHTFDCFSNVCRLNLQLPGWRKLLYLLGTQSMDWIFHSLILMCINETVIFLTFYAKKCRLLCFSSNLFREVLMGEGNPQPPLCWLPLWVVELGLVAESCTNTGSLYIICQHNSSTP